MLAQTQHLCHVEAQCSCCSPWYNK